MKIHPHLRNFVNGLIMEYGLDEPITKIGVHPKLLEALLREHANEVSSINGGCKITDFNEFEIYGIKFVARERDNF